MTNANQIADFKLFRGECIWLRICYNMNSQLFCADTERILTFAGATFFTDINVIMRHYIFQRVCVITDPVKSGKSRNLTIKAINANLLEAGLLTENITNLTEELHGYRTLILPARNKLISHLDRDAVLHGGVLGVHTEEQMKDFYENLQEYCDEVGWALGVGPLDFRCTASDGDALHLISVLNKAMFHDQKTSVSMNI